MAGPEQGYPELHVVDGSAAKPVQFLLEGLEAVGADGPDGCGQVSADHGLLADILHLPRVHAAGREELAQGERDMVGG
jgi:hypothetical protein